jgi:hypothetical protein
MAASASLRALLHRSIDYAGLFPPASLELEPAVTNQARYVRTPDNWMLNAFVLPVSKFEAVIPFLPQFDEGSPLRISALGPKTEDVAAFRESVQSIGATIRRFAAQNRGAGPVNQLEMFLPEGVGVDLLRETATILRELPAFWEAPVERADRAIALLKELHSNSESTAFGYKLRTGGVTADAFPTSEQIAGTLVAAAKAAVPIKFTAGLHHPIRQYRDEVKTKMHGFLNVLGAALLTAEHGWDRAQAARMVEDEDPGSFTFNDEFFAWREWKMDVSRIQERRRSVTTFGSCSFDEPGEDLRALKLL